MPPSLLFLHHESARGKKEAGEMLAVTLDHIARGGVYDHLGGGFHRYSTERTWTVPHFEKMLYDQAQLCEVYAAAYKESKSPVYKRAVQETLTFVERELTAPDGGFYSALDADADGEEGKFYVWTDKEIDAVVADKKEAALFKDVYGAAGEPNFEGKRIFLLPKSLEDAAKALELSEDKLEERLAPMRRALLEAREKRPRPSRDVKILTAWNGQMIAGYAAAGQALDDKKYIETAARAADFVLTKLRGKDGRLRRTFGAAPGDEPTAHGAAYLDDYAYLLNGLLSLHDATGDKRWLDQAKATADAMIEWHADKDGGFFYTASDHEKLFARSKDQYDGVQPCGNSAAARGLVRLWATTGDDKYAKADALAIFLDGKDKAK
jgi:uncharacterized protein YyaL (SSP411 family)